MRRFTPAEVQSVDFPVQFSDAITRIGGDLVDTGKLSVVRPDTKKCIAVVSKDYSLIPHQRVVTCAEQVFGDLGLNVQKKLFLTHDGARMFAEFGVSGKEIDVDADDRIGMRFLFSNSYDGSSSFRMGIEGLRLICLNGLMGLRELFSFHKKHVGEKFDDMKIVKEATEKGIEIYQNSMIPFWRKMVSVPISVDDSKLIMGNIVETNTLPGRYQADIQKQWEVVAEAKRNAWIFYNCYTHVLTHVIKQVSYANYLNHSRKVSRYFHDRFIN